MMEPDERTLAQARIEVLTGLVSDLMNRLVQCETRLRAITLMRQQEQPPDQGGAVA